MPQINTILNQIDLGQIALPQFQRGFVWKRPQIRALFRSLYRQRPVGGLLIWQTSAQNAETRGGGAVTGGPIQLLLDGQQRLTTIYGVVHGRPPEFSDEDAKIFTGLRFNVKTEEFEFFSPKMKEDPHWVDVTWVMQTANLVEAITSQPVLVEHTALYVQRLLDLRNVLNRNLPQELISGKNIRPDEVVEIFNQVNSGGTKLSHGDLALAKVSVDWPEARDTMSQKLEEWKKVGYKFSHDWLLRCVNVLITGEAKFSHLHDVDGRSFQRGLKQAGIYIDQLLTLINVYLGLDHNQALLPVSGFPVLVRYLNRCKGKLSAQQQYKLLYWYIQAGMWGRYASAPETALNQDIDLLDRGSLDDLVERLRLQRASLDVKPEHFAAWSRGARFYPILYMLTYRASARDFCFGHPLLGGAIGHRMKNLEMHHIFPKAQLYKHRYNRFQVNALANFCFLTGPCNKQISARLPEEYLPEIRRNHPGALESQWIPMDEELWKIENYERFLVARRRLLAEETNRQLEELRRGKAYQPVLHKIAASSFSPAEAPVKQVSGGVADDEEQEQIDDLRDWMDSHGLSRGQLSYELADSATGDQLAVLDLAWPSGIQPGLTEPVAVLLDEPMEVHAIANRAGFRFFTAAEKFKDYVRYRSLQ
ncbi:MAG: DUF262 domain-containing protein [Bacteroidota bacterium]|nr:DUF262 domain-containing protein [Bacteroidota bacterium]MDE2834576.1 DUF262 domain-containing protein [Bacteroidota bacterium]